MSFDQIGCFPLTKNSALNFQTFPVRNGTAFSGFHIFTYRTENVPKFPEKRTTSPQNLFTEISVPFDFAPGISKILSWMVRIYRFFCNFPRQEPLSKEISISFAPVWKFSGFLVANGKLTAVAQNSRQASLTWNFFLNLWHHTVLIFNPWCSLEFAVQKHA